LSKGVAGGPGYVDEIQLVGIHVEGFFHAGDVGIGDVGLVEVFDEVT
jgi:hypothetical protein